MFKSKKIWIVRIRHSFCRPQKFTLQYQIPTSNQGTDGVYNLHDIANGKYRRLIEFACRNMGISSIPSSQYSQKNMNLTRKEERRGLHLKSLTFAHTKKTKNRRRRSKSIS